MNSPRFPLAVRSVLTVVALLVAEIAGVLPTLALSGASDRVVTVVGGAGVALVAFGLAIVLVRFVDRRPIAALGLHVDRAGSLLGLLLIAAAVTAATGLTWALGLTESSGWEMFLPVALVQAFVLQAFPEELLFRGYLVQTAASRLSGRGVFVLSTLLFGALHIVSGSDATTLAQRLQFLLIPLGFGAIATVLRMATGSVWPAIAVHGGFHTTVYVLGGWVTPSPDSYGVFGATLCAVAAAVTYWAVRTGRIAWTPAPPLLTSAQPVR